MNLENLLFQDFKDRACNQQLSKYEKIGFPDSYREHKEQLIYDDLKLKLNLTRPNLNILDIGSGCSDLPLIIAKQALSFNQQVTFNDSSEMLENLKQELTAAEDLTSCKVNFLAGKFEELDFKTIKKDFDVVIAYSVMHHVIIKDSVFNFIDCALDLLVSGGYLLLGDLKNCTKRNRFFSSDSGRVYHQNYLKSRQLPKDTPLPAQLDFEDSRHHLDDALIMAIMQRYRQFGFETYLLPQSNSSLPFYGRREDLLIHKI
jgi:2-polyprenyl-3-methyl-5-hydroxy-6-metoxy-1,4-benzoquinol methylase